MRLIFIILCFILPVSYVYCIDCDSLKSKIQSINHSDSVSILIDEAINNSKTNNDIINWICGYKLKAKYYCETNDCKIKILENLINDNFFREPLTYDEKLEVAKAYVTLATYLKRNSLYKEAKENYEVADSLFQQYKIEAKDYKIGQLCLKSLGNIYTRLGDYERAMQTFERAEQQLILSEAKPNSFASLYVNWGNAYYNLGKYDALINIYQKGLNMEGLSAHYQAKMIYATESAKFRKYINIKYFNPIDSQKNISEFNPLIADKKLKEQIIVFEDRTKNNPRDSYNFLNGIYSLRAEIAQEFTLLPKEEIIEFHKKSLAAIKILKSDNQSAREIAKKHYVIGEAYFSFEETDSAKHHFYLGLKTILSDFKPSQNPLPKKELFFNENAIFENLEGLAEVFTLQDSLELALHAYELAFYVKLNLRSIYDFESSKLYLQQEAKEVNSKAIEVAWQLYKQTNDEQFVQRAFRIAESSRALVLLESIAKNQILKETENSDNLFTKQKAKFDKPISYTELQNHLSENETLIEYFQADSVLYAFKIEQNKTLKFYKLNPDFAQLDQLLETLRIPDNSAKAIDPFKKLANQLYKDILAPIQIPVGRKIIIIPDGQLNFLPFEVLLTKPSQENSFKKLPYMLNDHIVNYQYSTTIFSRLQVQSNQAKLNKILNIAPIFENTDHTLSASKEGVNEISAIFPSDELIKEQATKENILNKINQYNILHFSTHASSGDQTAKEQAHIVLHQDTLYLNEIYQQPLQANLVTLSACETNLGKYEGGEGVMSLSRAFAYAGCPSLVSTLWQVNDQSTKNIIVQFYENIKQGKTKDEALQQAKLAYFDKNDDVHPYYWASLVSIGNTQPLKRGDTFRFTNYLWLLFPFVIGSYFLYKLLKRKL